MKGLRVNEACKSQRRSSFFETHEQVPQNHKGLYQIRDTALPVDIRKQQELKCISYVNRSENKNA